MLPKIFSRKKAPVVLGNFMQCCLIEYRMEFCVPQRERLGLTWKYVERIGGISLNIFLFKLILNIKVFKHFIRELFATITMNSS